MRGKQYKNKLDAKSASEGIQLAKENAKSLLIDAELLFENGRFERSVSLAILSIEESGKSSIIRTILITDDPKELKKEWQNYRKHTAKNLSWILPELVTKGARNIENFRPIFDSQSDHGQILDNLKQLSFYTDVFLSKKWSIPKNVIDKEIAEMILLSARILTDKGDNDGIDSEEGLKLWIKHIKPVWQTSMSKMKYAIIGCYKEAAELGIISHKKVTEMTEFLK
ncbi:AbiV family abortive infection protein [Aquimarina sp. MAR_2010_214]|uniref:AbiV family abortive infection protein n=1 Tax=Aquimarina sp. MAR_2010_214 TaxID=1250026 RepID=UPI000C713CF2|nr:AbiV family abortive infection protein [Aquimarina sp. MAR_2010_214]PKV49591.1 AbiV family abortive infection protein [Aquimarina sp. MAR_2010_214]